MNWGGFGDGFSRGFNNGVTIGKVFGDAMKQKKVEDIRAMGIAEAQAARAADVNGAVKDNGEQKASASAAAAPAPMPAPAAQDGPPDRTYPVDMPGRAAPPATAGIPAAQQPAPAPSPVAAQESAPAPAAPAKRFTVGGKGFDTIDEARAHADKVVPSIVDYQVKTIAPKMQQVYMEQGDIEKAEAWGKWAKDKKNERHMETWAKAKISADMGDYEGAAQHLGALYKHYNDGVSVVDQQPVKDAGGNLLGFKIKVKNDGTGEEQEHSVKPDELVRMGLHGLSPDKMFALDYQEQSQAKQLAAKARIDAQNDRRTADREATRDQRTAEREEARLKAAEEREAARAAAAAEREEKRLKAQHENKLKELDHQDKLERGRGAHKKTTDPEERRALIRSDLMKNDSKFSRLTPAEQRQKIDEAMDQIRENSKAGPDERAPSAKPAGAIDPRSLVRDTKTGQVGRMVDGKFVPLN